MSRPENGACAELPNALFDRYFDSNGATTPRHSRLAKAICSQCVVLDICRQQALNMPEPIKRGVMGGATAWELKRARQWRLFELGFRQSLPEGSRPEWLERPAAVQAVAPSEDVEEVSRHELPTPGDRS